MIQCTNGCTSQQAACSCSGIDSSRSSVYLCKVGSSILCHCQHQRPDYGADICSFRFFCSVKPMSPVSNTENICPTMSYHQCVDEFQRYVFRRDSYTSRRTNPRVRTAYFFVSCSVDCKQYHRSTWYWDRVGAIIDVRSDYRDRLVAGSITILTSSKTEYAGQPEPVGNDWHQIGVCDWLLTRLW